MSLKTAFAYTEQNDYMNTKEQRRQAKIKNLITGTLFCISHYILYLDRNIAKRESVKQQKKVENWYTYKPNNTVCMEHVATYVQCITKSHHSKSTVEESDAFKK